MVGSSLAVAIESVNSSNGGYAFSGSQTVNEIAERVDAVITVVPHGESTYSVKLEGDET
jgi:hypothetical protein